ncbi:hypothetical protein HPP92_009934 [Vanilla planifolia]|uniref:Uncharacterized protein n=1 Tax=Vanilla planifolia TaxID=51239 RepID=A0A835QY04_VANPL|nr:hypothetical protein HPP92_009934 [Vanilla planifolia]
MVPNCNARILKTQTRPYRPIPLALEGSIFVVFPLLLWLSSSSPKKIKLPLPEVFNLPQTRPPRHVHVPLTFQTQSTNFDNSTPLSISPPLCFLLHSPLHPFPCRRLASKLIPYPVMTKAKEERRLILGLFWNCADTKLLLTYLFLLCSLLTLSQLLPSLSGIITLSSFSSSLLPPSKLSTIKSSTHPRALPDETLPDGVIRRSFTAIGSAAYLFVQMGAYRGSLDSFAIVGLASKPLHVFGKPHFRCEWHPSSPSSAPIPSSQSYQMLPDWGFGRIYTVVVVNCTFSSPINADGSGGRLLLFASPSAAGPEDPILALEESPGQFNSTTLAAPPKYDYLYCGSSLYGNLSPQRIREWIAYHARLFGSRGHIVLHDAGGCTPASWMSSGRGSKRGLSLYKTSGDRKISMDITITSS